MATSRLPMPDKKAEPIGSALKRYLDTQGLAKRVGQATALEAWPHVVGAAVAAAAKPLSVASDGTLIVAVRSSAWMNELSLMERELLEALNRANPSAPLTRIRWTIAP
jgi:predicted nucleic acid-binding Zn ribbon protein